MYFLYDNFFYVLFSPHFGIDGHSDTSTTSGTFTCLCRLRSIAAHKDHFVRRLSVRPSVYVSCLSGSHTFLVVTHSYISQATHAFHGMLPLFFN